MSYYRGVFCDPRVYRDPFSPVTPASLQTHTPGGSGIPHRDTVRARLPLLPRSLPGTIIGRADIDPATGEANSVDVTLKADADLVTERKETIKIMGTLSVQLRRSDLPPPGPPKK
jgi:hypothetical protein